MSSLMCIDCYFNCMVRLEIKCCCVMSGLITLKTLQIVGVYCAGFAGHWSYLLNGAPHDRQ